MKQKLLSLIAAILVLAVLFAGCAGGSSDNKTEDTFRFGMVTDVGGINDQGFNQSAWTGLQQLKDELGYDVKYLESSQEADYASNLDKLADEELDMIWSIGFMMQDAAYNAAIQNPELKFGIVDTSYDEIPDNMQCVLFRAQESCFLAGYIAGRMTQTDHVGFIGAMKSVVIDQFEYGFRSGVAYAAKELGKEIAVDIQYTESFTDTAKNKAVSLMMYNNGADIILPCGATLGSIEAAKEMNKYAIGIDMDQNYLAPDNVITSCMKNVGNVIVQLCKEVANDNYKGGVVMTFGLAEGAVGLSPTTDKLVPSDIRADADSVAALIIDGTIVPPQNESEYDAFIAALGA